MNRLPVVLGAMAAILAVSTTVQTLRLWAAQDQVRELRVASAVDQKETKRTARARTGGVGSDTWNPVANGTLREKNQEGGSDAAPGTGANDSGTQATRQSAAGGRTGTAPGVKKGVTPAPDAETKPADAGTDAAARSDELSRSALQSIKDGNLDQARTMLQQSVQENPKNSDAWRNLVSVDRQLGKSQEELDAFQQWISQCPEDKLARYMAAEAYARNGMDDQALQYLSDFQKMSTDNPQSYAMSAGIYQQMNMTSEQGDALRQWVNAAPNSPDAHRVLGDYYQRQGQNDQALAEYQAMASLQPNTSTPYIQMGNTYSQMGQLDAAEAQFATAVNIRPNDVEALTRLADTQRQLGDLQNAAATYQRVVSLEPGSSAGVQAARSIQYIQEELNAQAQQAQPPR